MLDFTTDDNKAFRHHQWTYNFWKIAKIAESLITELMVTNPEQNAIFIFFNVAELVNNLRSQSA